ncbi:MAG: methyltransferase domain-containing protein [Sedimentisphaerales bacterium]|nr:methyltransferase domain-containing protein [Sedimentisphaerales bacterium]
MTRIRRLFFSFSLASLFFVSCQTNQQVSHFDKPTARIIDIKFKDVQLDYATLLFEIEVENPYPADLPLVSINYSLTSGGNTFLTAAPAKAAPIAPNSKELVSLPDEVIYARLLRSLNGNPGSTIPYRTELQLWVDAPDLGQIKLHLRHEGLLSLPEEAEITVDGRIYHSLDVPFVFTPADVVDKMLQMAKLKKDDLVYDLGCGDGRIPVTAASKYGCKAVGYDLDPERVKESLENAKKNKVEHLVTIEQKDIFTLDLSEADVITLYLLPALNVKLIPQLEKLKPGSRILSHNFDMKGVKPDKVVRLTSSFDNLEHEIYLWTTPLKKIDNQ